MTRRIHEHDKHRDGHLPDLESLKKSPDSLSQAVAKLINGGARFTQDPQLGWVVALGDEQRAQLERTHVIQPKIDQLLESTEIGQRIAAQARQLDDLKRVIWSVALPKPGEARLGMITARSFKAAFKDYFDEHGYGEQDKDTIDIDWQKLDQKDERYADFIEQKVVKKGKEGLDALAVGLIERPDLEIGNRVTVLRSYTDPQGQRVKESWIITDITLPGMIRVRPEPEATAYKDLPMKDIEELN